MAEKESPVRGVLGAVRRGALVSFAGLLVAASVTSVVIVVLGPDAARSAALARSSAVASVVLITGLGFAGARSAGRGLRHATAPTAGALALVLATAGPVGVTILANIGVAADGRPVTAALAVSGAVVGAIAGARHGLGVAYGRASHRT